MATNHRGLAIGSRPVFKFLDGEYLPDGFRRAGVIYAVPLVNLVSNFPVVGTEIHPVLGSNWKAYTYRWRHHEKISKSLVFLQVDYISAETAIQEDEADSIAAEEPITSHPNFLNDLSGSPAIAGSFTSGVTVDPATGKFTGTPRAGVKFQRAGQNKTPAAVDYREDVGTFIGFLPGATLGGASIAGLERYLLPQGTFTRSFSTFGAPSLAGVGSQTSGTPYRAPALNTGFGWLLVRRGYKRLGLIYRVTETWRAGRWHPVIYPVSAAADGPAPT